MSFHLHPALAHARVDELRRAAAAHNVAQLQDRPARARPATASVTLRFGGPADQTALARLAQLDSAAPPALPVLLAELGGEVVAALSLADETVVADPFRRTADLVELLRARARQLGGEPPARTRRRTSSWFRPAALARR